MPLASILPKELWEKCLYELSIDREGQCLEYSQALCLWEVYLALTVAETLLLTLGGMSLFEAVVHSFATIATGGFSTRNASIAAFHSPYIEWVITAFMFASGVNFSLYFLLFARRVRAVLGDEELRWYAAIVAASALAIALCLLRRGFSGVEPALREIGRAHV